MNISQKSSNFANGIKWKMPKIPQRVGKTKINMIMAQFKVVKIPSDTQHEDERFNAFFYSKDYETIFGSLSVKGGNSVVVEPISKITYSWQNLDIIGKVSFIVSIIAFILSLLNMFNII